MKTITSKSMRHITLALLIAAPVGLFATTAEETAPAAEDPTRQSTLEYENAFALMQDFLNLKVKKEKSIDYWAKQLIELIKQKDKKEIVKLKPFVKDFHGAYRSRNALMLGMAFKNHKDKFAEPALASFITQKIKQNGLNSILAILKQRLKK